MREDPSLRFSESPWWIAPGVLLRLALGLTAAVYARTVTFDFVFDDAQQITLNEWIQSLRFLPLYFAHQVKVVVLAVPQWAGNYYRPLFNVWLALNYAVFGAVPGWWHLSTVGAHVFVTWLVYRLARRLTGNESTSAFAALLFGLNPLHIEAVAWISGVTEVQLAGCFILSILAYLNWRQGGRARRWWMAAALTCFALALLSKETAVVLPGIVLAYEWLYGEFRLSWAERWRGLVLRLAPFAGILAVYFAARFYVLGRLANPNYPRPTSWVLLTIPSVLWFYLRQLLWPFRISEFYDVDLQRQFSLSRVLLPAVVVLAAMAATWILARRSRLVKFLLLWLALPMMPVIAAVAFFTPHDYVHDRYLYVPSVAVAIMLALGVEWLATTLGRNSKVARVALLVLLPLALGITTVVQVGQWDSDLALAIHAVKTAPNSVLAREYLARAYMQTNDFENGLREFRNLLRAHPEYSSGHLWLGITDYELGNYPEAEHDLKQAMQTWQNDGAPRPDSRQFYYLGLTLMKLGRPREAEAPLRHAVTLRPDAVGYHDALGSLLQELGKADEAQEHFAQERKNRAALLELERKYGLLR